MFRGRAVVLVLVAAIGGVCGTSIESMSGSITVMVDQGGSLLVQPTGGTPQTVAMAQDVAALSGAVTAVNTSANQAVTALSGVVTSVNNSVTTVRAEMAAGQGALGSRIDNAGLALVAAGRARSSLSTSTASVAQNVMTLQLQLASANAQIAALVQSINSIADCSTGSCVPRIAVCNLSALSGLSARGLAVTMPPTVNSGAAVSVGGAILFAAQSGYFLPATAAQVVTCTGHGWTAAVPTPGPCIANCGVCSGPTGCSMCASGFVVNVTAPFARLSFDGTEVSVDPRGPSANSQRPPNAANLAIGERNLVDGTPNAGLWYQAVSYENRECTDPAWIQVDVGTQMRMGSVTTWMYWLDGRQYCGQRIAVSPTGVFAGEETEIYSTPATDYGHAERSAGNTVFANGIVGRYVRFWSARSNVNVGTHFVGMTVSAASLVAPGSSSCSPTA